MTLVRVIKLVAKAILPAKTRLLIRRVASNFLDLLKLYPRVGSLAYHSYRRNSQNLSFLYQHREDMARGGDVPYLNDIKIADPVPRIIWAYWHTGLESAPEVVRLCAASWKEHNPGWEVRFLDDTAIKTWTDLSDLPESLPHRMRANVLRLRLLAQYGGVWADSTVYCHRPFDEWLPLQAMSGFFAFSNPGRDRIIDNWFFAAAPQQPLMAKWADRLARTYKAVGPPPYYFWMIYTFEWLLKNDKDLRSHWEQTGSTYARPCFLLQGAVDGHCTADRFAAARDAGLGVSKLSWRAERMTPERLRDVLCHGTEGALSH